MSSVNKYKQHLFILPEDQHNIDIANGFQMHECVVARNMQILNPAGGHENDIEVFLSHHQHEMRKYNLRFMVLLVDFDNDPSRLIKIKSQIPGDICNRVFVVGAWDEPRDVVSGLCCSREQIGRRLAEDCLLNSTTTWGSPMLRNNLGEVARLNIAVRPFLLDISSNS